MIEKSIANLKKRLLLPLPGKVAQFKLAPTYRPAIDDTGSKHLAGVLILLYPKDGRLYFPLIERPVYNGAHSGQISFPGGKMESHDRNLTVTALRECEEEIGIDATKISVLGSLTNLFIPVSKFEVHPVVGYYNEKPLFIPQASEVVSIIEAPVELILQDSVIEQKKVVYNGLEETIPFFNINNKTIWGATAMILSEFIHVWNDSLNLYSETKFL